MTIDFSKLGKQPETLEIRNGRGNGKTIVANLVQATVETTLLTVGRELMTHYAWRDDEVVALIRAVAGRLAREVTDAQEGEPQGF